MQIGMREIKWDFSPDLVANEELMAACDSPEAAGLSWFPVAQTVSQLFHWCK
jgi:hypothetical protein